MMTAPMESDCLGPAGLPHTTRLYAAYLEHFSRVAEFYEHVPTLDGIARAAASVRLDANIRQGVVDVLREQNRAWGRGPDVSRSLDRLAEGAVAVVTGQQVGLFGGPAYSVYKALTALHLAEELTSRGTPAVAVFWMATEDHDLAEVSHCAFGTRSGPERFELATSDGAGRLVGEIPLGDAVRGLVDRAKELLEGPDSGAVAAWLEEAYRPEGTYGAAFAKLLTSIFSERGLVVLDPMSPKLHHFAAPILRRALEEHAEIARELVARNKRLERDGFHSQVKVVERSTLLFRVVNGKRLPLKPKNSGLAAGALVESLAEALLALDRSPEDFSPSALLRPVVQDALLPTAAYIGGSAEIAYLAQASLVYRRLLGRMPAVLPRAGFTLVDPHVARLMKKYNVALTDVFSGRQKLRAKLDRETLPKSFARRFDDGNKALRRTLARLRTPLGKLDHTLLGALDTAEKKMLYQFTHLREKAGRAEAFRTGVLDAHERELLGMLYPHHALQERSLCFLPFFAAHGTDLLNRLEKKIQIGSGNHCVIHL